MTATLEGTAVLVADDDPDNLQILGFIISAEGATVRTARNGHEALDLLGNWTPDVLLLDIEMPDMDGYELLSVIRGRADLHDVPAVAVTALGFRRDKDRAFAAGFEAHITKPFDGRALLDLVEWLASRPHPRGRDARRCGGGGAPKAPPAP
jgi:CheY-like chemotaxis protein